MHSGARRSWRDTAAASREWINQLFAGRIMARGVPGFFEPRMPPPYLMPRSHQLLRRQPAQAALERLVDFDRINGKEMRFSVGAVRVRTGNFAYFDNETHVIRPEHVMASGALPPAFDAVEIDGEFCWNGGLVSNTPLDWVLSSRSGLDTLVLQVDLWSARGMLPVDFAEVAQMPPELAATPQAKMLAQASDPAVYNIVQLVYRSATYEGQVKDFEFSRRTMEEHWRAGYDDATVTLSHPEVLTLPTTAQGVAIYDFLSAVVHPRPLTSREGTKT